MKTTFDPATHVLVPRTPTEKMLNEAVLECSRDHSENSQEQSIARTYQRMLAAAPEPPREPASAAVDWHKIADERAAEICRLTAQEGVHFDPDRNGWYDRFGDPASNPAHPQPPADEPSALQDFVHEQRQVRALEAADDARHARLILDWFAGKFEGSPSEANAAWAWLRRLAQPEGGGK